MIDDVKTPYTDGWWLKRLIAQLREQQKKCQLLQNRYEGNAPLPFVSDIQRTAVRWFVEKSRTNFERLIVNAVLSRMRIVGLRTAANDGEGGDADAFTTWRKARMKLVVHDILKMTLSMGLGYGIVGKDADGNLLVTAEDPRLVTCIVDPANPYKTLAGVKLYHDDVADEDVAYLYLQGRYRVARRPRKARVTTQDINFTPAAWAWDAPIMAAADEDDATVTIETGLLPGLEGLCPVVQFVGEDGMAEFEPYLTVIDRINQQILQRMTIATVQAFKQRAFKGLPVTDPKTGQPIDYDAIFVADPGAIWNVPAGIDIWESGQVDLQPILLAIRDDIKDLAATSGTPLYSISPDVANGSAEGASLQRETLTFKVETRQDSTEHGLEMLAELMFRTLGDVERSAPGTIEVLWAPAERWSMTERANAIAQTRGVIPVYQALTEIWGMDPAQANRAMDELTQDLIRNQQYAAVAPASNVTNVNDSPAAAPAAAA